MLKILQNLKFLLLIDIVLIFSIAYYKSNLLSAFFDEIACCKYKFFSEQELHL